MNLTIHCSNWNNIGLQSVFIILILYFTPSFADTPIHSPDIPATDVAPDLTIKVMSINKSCVQPACNKTNAGSLCSCGTKLGYGVCSSNGAMCDRCKKCMPIDPINDELPHDSGPNN